MKKYSLVLALLAFKYPWKKGLFLEKFEFAHASI